MKSIYLDYNASTQVDNSVLEAMLPFFTENYCNPSNTLHEYGAKALEAIENSQEIIARYLGVFPEDIVFTSGATESNNLAIRGVLEASGKDRKHIITSKIEHPSVIETCAALERRGVTVTYVPVDKNGLVSIEDIRNSITDNTLLISIMAANNEIGTIQPIEEIGDLAVRENILFHTDATQYFPTGRTDLRKIKADLISFSGHKFYGPKGVGCLYINSDRVKIEPQIWGGRHQRNIRSGTMNVPSIVGIGVATDILYRNAEKENLRIANLRDTLLKLISKENPIIVNGSMIDRIPSNLNITIPGVSALALTAIVPDVIFSAGSACSVSSKNVSYVLKSVGLDDESIKCSIRLSLGKFTTEDEIQYAAKKLTAGINMLFKLPAA